MERTPDPGNEPTLDSGLSLPSGLSLRYDILNEVGSGGMGIVYKARDRETGTIVAVKVLHPEIAGRAELIERFKTELILARKITHKNVCRVYDLNRFDRVVAISMEYVEGQSLRALLDRPEGISIRYGLKIVHQVIAGLAEAHAQGVIHRDLKPENILIARDGTVKVMDFGIARSIDTGATLTGTITGTPAYMSPEQARGKTVDANSDIYSLGLVMYEMFCGQRAFTGDTPIAVAMKQVQEAPTPPHEIDPHVPAFLTRAILKCIEKNPAKRFQSLAELETALSESQADLPIVGASPAAEPPLPPQLRLWQRSDWLLLPAAIAGLLVFFPSFNRVSLAPRTPISFDRSVLRRIAEEYAQRLGAPVSSNSQVDIQALPDRYDYIAEKAGAKAALELANNPIPYWIWIVGLGNGTAVHVDNLGHLSFFARNVSASAEEKTPTEEAQALAEKGLRSVFNWDPARVRFEERFVNDTWRGQPALSFIWSDTANYYGIRRRYVGSIVGREIAFLGVSSNTPQGYERSDTTWQVLPWLGFTLILLVAGLFQRHLVNLYSRWRLIATMFGLLGTGWVLWLTLTQPLIPFVGIPTAIMVTVVASLATALLVFFVFIPVEWAARRLEASKFSTLIRLLDHRASSAVCGLAILRGTCVGLALLGVDTFLVWASTNTMGLRLDGFGLIYLQGHLYLGNSWPGPMLILYPLYLAVGIVVVVTFLTSVVARAMRGSWFVVVTAAALCGVIFPAFTMGAVQPFYGKVLVLALDFLILIYAFLRFDVLTLFVAAFTSAFCWQNYTLLVMHKPTGSFDEVLAFAAWGLFVIAAAGVAFQSSLISAYRRAAAAFE